MGVDPLGSGARVGGEVVVLTTSDRGMLRLAVGVTRAVAILAAVGLLAGCPANWADGVGQGSGGTGGDGGNGIDGFGLDGFNFGGNDFGGKGSPGAPGRGRSDSGSVTGSGRLVSRLIALPGVTSVVVGASFVVRLTVGEPEQATIRFDDNLADRVEATVTGGQLRLGLKPGRSVRNATLSAEVTVRDLDQLTTSGAAQVTLVSPPTGPALQLTTSGASRVTGPVRVDRLEASQSGASVLALSGQVSSLRLNTAGANQLIGPDLAVSDLDAVLSGTSQATVAVSKTLAATANGVSVLRYRGTPRITRQQTSGVSAIVRNSR